MSIEISPAVERLLNEAEDKARVSRGQPAGPIDIFDVLLRDEDSRVAQLLDQQGISAHSVRQALTALPRTENASVNEVLRAASRLSRTYGADETITTDFLLLSLLQTEPSLRDLMITQGVKLDVLERGITGETEPIQESSAEISYTDEPDIAAVARIMDVSANRAMESLRILEDYARFVLDDAHHTATIKSLRHVLAELLEELPARYRLQARDTPGDVGTTISTDREQARHSAREVAFINGRRLIEALRSLEEYGKVIVPGITQRIEQLRYRVYTLEKTLFLEADSRTQLQGVNLCVLLSAAECEASLDWTIEEAAAGGASMFQLREKHLDDRSLLARAREMRRWTKKTGTLFIVNDRVDIARLVEADGVHLGQDDLPVREARRILGTDSLIGVSTHNLDQLRQAIREGANYLGIGPIFPSKTKQFEHFPGLDFLRVATQETKLPLFAIGGIDLTNIAQVVAAGATRVAVSSVIARAEEPRQVARSLCEAIAEQRGML